MGMTQTSLVAGLPRLTLLQDPLTHLPCSTVFKYRKGETIYSHNQPSTKIYLVIDGKVKVCRLADDHRQVMVDLYQPDDFFGESAFVGQSHGTELAVALEATKVMTWTPAEIEDLAAQRPMLAVAFLQLLVQRSMDFGTRIESFSVDNIPRRLARALIRFSERMGHELEDGSTQMIPLTHELLSQYVGTSREIVSHYMNQFRRQGYLLYSRDGILLHRDAMREWLRREKGSPKRHICLAASPSLWKTIESAAN